MMRSSASLLEKLVIVESPNKVIKVEGLLSDPRVVPDWSFKLDRLKAISTGPERAIAMATTGHFMSLKELSWVPQSMVTKPEDSDFPANGVLASFALEWEVISGRRIQDTVSHYIQEKAKDLTEIIIATDPDREGELIAMHALNLIRGMFPEVDVPFTRAYMHSITADGIRTAMAERQEVFDSHLANAAEARHAMDRIFGFLGSSVVRYANPQMRSIGRVQTPALILIAERERKIAQFVESHKTTYQVRAECKFSASNGLFFSQIVQPRPRNADATPAETWANEKSVQQLASQWNLGKPRSIEIAQDPVITTTETPPPEPFTMATLIAKANRQLHLSSEEASSCLQDLFQMGFITYPRTDSTRIDEAVLTSIYSAVTKEFGKSALSKLGSRPAGGKRGSKHAAAGQQEGNVEDAHEAIRPTDINVRADALGRSISASTKQVYDLVRRNTLAAFMVPLKTERVLATVNVTAANGDELAFTLDGKHTVAPGWSQAFRAGNSKGGPGVAEQQLDAEAAESGKDIIPSISDEEFKAIVGLKRTALGSRGTSGAAVGISLHNPQVLEFRPSPPLPYSEGGLVEELRSHGVGRPSTYPMIVKTLLARSYITVNKGRCETTDIGRMLVETSKSTFPSIVDIGFTAAFEKKLDRIAKPDQHSNEFVQAQKNITEADYVLSSFVSKFLNYVTDATRAQRAIIAERSVTLKRTQDGGNSLSETALQEEIKRESEKAAALVPDLLENCKNYRTFTALQNSLNDYLRRNFPASTAATGGSGSWAGRRPRSSTRFTSFTQYAKKKTAKSSKAPRRSRTAAKK